MTRKLMQTHSKKSLGGFTLIEVLVVIVIIAILAGVIIMSVGGVFGDAKRSAYNTAREQIQIAFTAYGANASHSGQTAYVAGVSLNNADCENCYVIEIDKLLSKNYGMLRQAPDGLALNGSSDNCNTSDTLGACKTDGHYTWIVNSKGDVYSYCVGACSDNNSGYKDVWP